MTNLSLRSFVYFSVFCVVGFCVQPVQLQAAPTTRPARSGNSAKTATLTVDKGGQYYFNQRRASLFAIMRLLRKLKTRASHSRLAVQIDPRAPYRKVLVLQTLLKESKLSFSTQMKSVTHVGGSTSRPAPSRPQPTSQPAPRPPARRAAAPVRPRPVAIRPVARPVLRAKAPAVKTTVKQASPTSIDWSKIPTQTARGLTGPRTIELRMRAVDAVGNGVGGALTGFVYYKGRSRRPVGRLSTNNQGYARYIFKVGANSPKDMRVAVLHDTHFYEFPVPVAKAQGRFLYLRLNLKGGKKVSGHGKNTAKTPARAVAKVPQKPIKSLPWASAPMSKVIRGKKGHLVEFRVLLSVNGTPIANAPTGLLLGRGKKRGSPIGRLRANKQGMLRYQVRALSGVWYALAVMVDSNNPTPSSLKLRNLPLPKDKRAIRYIRMDFSTKKKVQSKARNPHNMGKKVTSKATPGMNYVFQGLHLLVEPFDVKHVRVTTFATMVRPPSFQRPPSLPVGLGGRKIQLGPQFGKLSPETKGLRIVARQVPQNTRFQLSYSYLLPINTGNEKIHVEVMPDYGIIRASLFLHPKLKLLTDLGKKLRDIRSRGKKPKIYGLYALSKAKKGKKLIIDLQNTIPYQRGFLGWVKRTYKSRRRNKLLGLGVIFAISLLGVFLLVGGRREEETPVAPVVDAKEEDNAEDDDDGDSENAEETSDTDEEAKETSEDEEESTTSEDAKEDSEDENEDSDN